MTQRKARAKSPSKVGRGAAPQRTQKNYFSTLMETPEGRELRRQWSTKKRKNPGRRKACLTDIAKRRSNLSVQNAKKRAEKAVQISCPDKYNIEDTYAQEALQTAVEIMQGPARPRTIGSSPSGTRFLCKKSASKQEVTIGKVEEFLASILEEER